MPLYFARAGVMFDISSFRGLFQCSMEAVLFEGSVEADKQNGINDADRSCFFIFSMNTSYSLVPFHFARALVIFDIENF